MKPEDLRVDIISGARDVVRITHLPSGFVEECDEQATQLRNKAQCIINLRKRLGEPDPQDELIPITIHLRRRDLHTFIEMWRSFV